jgi:hypothetical protein
MPGIAPHFLRGYLVCVTAAYLRFRMFAKMLLEFKEIAGER